MTDDDPTSVGTSWPEFRAREFLARLSGYSPVEAHAELSGLLLDCWGAGYLQGTEGMVELVCEGES